MQALDNDNESEATRTIAQSKSQAMHAYNIRSKTQSGTLNQKATVQKKDTNMEVPSPYMINEESVKQASGALGA